MCCKSLNYDTGELKCNNTINYSSLMKLTKKTAEDLIKCRLEIVLNEVRSWDRQNSNSNRIRQTNKPLPVGGVSRRRNNKAVERMKTDAMGVLFVFYQSFDKTFNEKNKTRIAKDLVAFQNFTSNYQEMRNNRWLPDSWSLFVTATESHKYQTHLDLLWTWPILWRSADCSDHVYLFWV